MDWAIVELAIPLLFAGLYTTVRICLLSIVLGAVLGFVLGLAAFSRSAVVRWSVRGYVDFIRGTPILIQIFLVYFALPGLGINLSEFWAGVVALSLNAGGFIGEIVRAGINSVERGQSEAAKSIGMTGRQVLIYILLPQAMRPIVPPLTNELVNLIKGSALLSVISVYELTRAGQAIISTHFVPFEIYFLIALYYYVVISAVAYLSRLLERRLPVW
ncbi:MAG: amino acid ABC transporter permease [Proteobacteria bacterium]|nr:amino acid ABC transporter permease [Pseudomonadota bacterium]